MPEPSSSDDASLLNLINKRLRGLRKKLRRINNMEGKKHLNKDEEKLLLSKSIISGCINELEDFLKEIDGQERSASSADSSPDENKGISLLKEEVEEEVEEICWCRDQQTVMKLLEENPRRFYQVLMGEHRRLVEEMQMVEDEFRVHNLSTEFVEIKRSLLKGLPEDHARRIQDLRDNILQAV